MSCGREYNQIVSRYANSLMREVCEPIISTSSIEPADKKLYHVHAWFKSRSVMEDHCRLVLQALNPPNGGAEHFTKDDDWTKVSTFSTNQIVSHISLIPENGAFLKY